MRTSPTIARRATATTGVVTTSIGRGLYPKAPDMTLSDDPESVGRGELRIIENGIRLTGMPAWGNGTPESAKASWELVHFIRHFSSHS